MFVIPEAEIRAKAADDGVTHLSTGIAITRDGKVLVVRRAASDYLGGQYELPGGGVNEDETLEQAVVREALEETGQRVTAIVDMFGGFDYATPKKPHVRQSNFVVETEMSPITLEPTEHDDFRWIGSPEELDDITMSDNMKICVKAALAKL